MSSLASPIAALGVNVVAQVMLFRVRRGAQYFRSIIEAFLLGGIALLLCEAISVARSDGAFDRLFLAIAVNLPTYICLSFCYYSFVQLGQTSIRIRMYSEIVSREAGVTIAEIEREYDEAALTEVRLRRLLESGDIAQIGDRFVIGRKRLLVVANLIFAAKRVLLGKKTEFE